MSSRSNLSSVLWSLCGLLEAKHSLFRGHSGFLVLNRNYTWTFRPTFYGSLLSRSPCLSNFQWLWLTWIFSSCSSGHKHYGFFKSKILAMWYGADCRLWPAIELEAMKIVNSLSTIPLLNVKYLWDLSTFGCSLVMSSSCLLRFVHSLQLFLARWFAT